MPHAVVCIDGAVGREVAKPTVGRSGSAGGPAPGKPKQIADELRGLIIEGRLDEGDLLGTEAELLERFEVSRPSLRESLRILEAEGLISVVRGALERGRRAPARSTDDGAGRGVGAAIPQRIAG